MIGGIAKCDSFGTAPAPAPAVAGRTARSSSVPPVVVADRPRHAGPLWRHEPGNLEQIAIGVVWAGLLVLLGIAGAFPDQPFDPADWVRTYATTLVMAAPAFVLVELVHHRVVSPSPSEAAGEPPRAAAAGSHRAVVRTRPAGRRRGARR
ncbi:MAG TPA: hypothetical protein VHR55_05625 [Candidatus Limnocylindria bacterium]|nr:hypothetical protein [Candidatus Limnocylindria bacterium]